MVVYIHMYVHPATGCGLAVVVLHCLLDLRKQLAALPLPPQIGALLLAAVPLDCEEWALTLAAMLSTENVWSTPFNLSRALPCLANPASDSFFLAFVSSAAEQLVSHASLDYLRRGTIQPPRC